MEVCSAAAHGCLRAVCYWVSLQRGRLNEPRGLGYRPRTPTDWDPRIQRRGVMPFDGWKSWSVSAERWGLFWGSGETGWGTYSTLFRR